MPRDNWQQRAVDVIPDFIPDEAYVEKRLKDQAPGSRDPYVAPVREKDFPLAGMGWAPTGGAPDFIPDADYNAKKGTMYITKEQEAYGLEWKPGDPRVAPKRKKRKGGINPFSGEWEE